MSKDVFTKNRIRKYFGKIREVAEMPNLIEIQKSSYDLFLNSGEGSGPQKGEGIRGAFESIFPIKDFIFSLARTRGIQIGSQFAESFEVVRWVIK